MTKNPPDVTQRNLTPLRARLKKLEGEVLALQLALRLLQQKHDAAIAAAERADLYIEGE